MVWSFYTFFVHSQTDPSYPSYLEGNGTSEGQGTRGSQFLQFQAFHLSACFSLDGARLLTTDQNNEIRVYSASQWDSPLSLISHPHRHFQHLTPIKVSDYGNGPDPAKLGKGSYMQPTISDALSLNPLALSALFILFL